jgi:hypothetical protein
VRRAVAIALGAALVWSWGSGPARHVHVYTDHDHPEHHHGPAAHEHPAALPHPEDGAAHLEACDQALHAVSVSPGLTCEPSSPVLGIDGDFVTPSIVHPERSSHRAVHLILVRAHGPPARGRTSPRAPPQICPV